MNTQTIFPDSQISSFEDIQKQQQTPLEQMQLPESTYHLLQGAAKKNGDKVAMRFLANATTDEQSIDLTYNQLFARITQTANAFYQLGVNSGDTVSLLLPNLPQTHFAIWGGEAAGIVNPINPMLEIEHIAAILEEAQSKVLVTLGPSLSEEMWQKALQLVDKVDCLQHVLTVDRQGTEHHNDKVQNFDALIAQQNPQGLDSGRDIKATDIASYFHTGGTTGTPKLAPHTHANEVAACWQIVFAANIKPNAVALTGLPLFHVNAVFVTGLAVWFAGGEAIIATAAGYRTPEVIGNFWQLIEKYRISYFSCVPTILSGLLTIPSDGCDLSSLDFTLCGAAPLATELFRKFEEKTGLIIVEGYGQTEGAVASTVNPKFGERKIGSVGIPLPYCEVKIVEVDEQGNWIRDCDVNQAGVIAIRGANVFNGYKREEQNRGLFFEGGWFNSGDMGRLDEDGYLWLTGRSKDLIIRGGHNIDPKAIEEPMYKHPAIAEAAAVGKPDQRVGELPVLFVQLNDGHDVTTEQLMAFANEHIAERAAIPKDIFIVEQMPLTAVGKVFKPTLRNQLVERITTEALINLGIQQFTVSAKQDKQLGQVAIIQCDEALQAQITDALGDYNFKLVFEE